MGELLPRQRAQARRKGWMAVGGWAVTVLLGMNGAPWWLIAPVLVVAGWLTRVWFLYRAQWGLRF